MGRTEFTWFVGNSLSCMSCRVCVVCFSFCFICSVFCVYEYVCVFVYVRLRDIEIVMRETCVHTLRQTQTERDREIEKVGGENAETQGRNLEAGIPCSLCLYQLSHKPRISC